jgi:hypothetical protein
LARKRLAPSRLQLESVAGVELQPCRCKRHASIMPASGVGLVDADRNHGAAHSRRICVDRNHQGDIERS